ncbi:hypothetical protein H4R26_003716 [Coemansia thaxteri]|uniref:SLC41A/MgtE integral membrane domain-containing protein n=1 Tax=Coemansia thaxteri TaxID=2663907 RepID=A0A9W8BAN8_9FUNG|nr:hypothetical protein H4R26_003716 [Coemansia thaxteri]
MGQKTPRQVVRELTIEVLPALLVSVSGSVVAGYILGAIQNKPAFDQVPALFIMVPVLLNLKSNIELNMSTRLSTQANLGVFDRKSEAVRSMRSNMELLLLQSTVVGACVGLISSFLSLIPSSNPPDTTPGQPPVVIAFFLRSAMLLAAGIGCAVIGSAVIGVLISATVAASHAVGVDPDNIGTPITSSFVRSNEQMAHHISEGWLPLVYAAVTSSIAGIIVERCADRFPGMPALVPVMNGLGGNIGTVFASRLSTTLHRHGRHHRPHAAFYSEHNLVMLILLLINLPVQFGFLAMHRVVDLTLVVSPWFVLIYTSATVIHGLAILFLARLACTYLWSRGHDPDDCVNPFITGTGDMLGTILLALVFIIIS